MPFWFLEDLCRLNAEKSAIEQLAGSTRWLVGFAWGIDGEGLYLDATICAHDFNYEVKMRYPTHFPYVPPAVHPSSAEERWSAHQYVNGTLCLEWGPDTWYPSITGAQVLQSAYTLLEIENPQWIPPGRRDQHGTQTGGVATLPDAGPGNAKCGEWPLLCRKCLVEHSSRRAARLGTITFTLISKANPSSSPFRVLRLQER